MALPIPLISYAANGGSPTPISAGASASISTAILLTLTLQSTTGVTGVTYVFKAPGTFLDGATYTPTTPQTPVSVELPVTPTTYTITTTTNDGTNTASNTNFLVATSTGTSLTTPNFVNALVNQAPVLVPARQTIFADGYASQADGGEGTWNWKNGTFTSDGGTVIVPTGYAGIGAWQRALDKPLLNPAHFGAIGDVGVDINGNAGPNSGKGTDVTAIIQAVVDLNALGTNPQANRPIVFTKSKYSLATGLQHPTTMYRISAPIAANTASGGIGVNITKDVSFDHAGFDNTNDGFFPCITNGCFGTGSPVPTAQEANGVWSLVMQPTVAGAYACLHLGLYPQVSSCNGYVNLCFEGWFNPGTDVPTTSTTYTLAQSGGNLGTGFVSSAWVLFRNTNGSNQTTVNGSVQTQFAKYSVTTSAGHDIGTSVATHVALQMDTQFTGTLKLWIGGVQTLTNASGGTSDATAMTTQVPRTITGATCTCTNSSTSFTTSAPQSGINALVPGNLLALGGVSMTGGPSVTFSNATHTIVRAAGSFVTDGFAIGQLVTAGGSTVNNPGALGVLTGVSASTLTFASGIVNEGSLSGVTLTAVTVYTVATFGGSSGTFGVPFKGANGTYSPVAAAVQQQPWEETSIGQGQAGSFPAIGAAIGQGIGKSGSTHHMGLVRISNTARYVLGSNAPFTPPTTMTAVADGGCVYLADFNPANFAQRSDQSSFHIGRTSALSQQNAPVWVDAERQVRALSYVSDTSIRGAYFHTLGSGIYTTASLRLRFNDLMYSGGFQGIITDGFSYDYRIQNCNGFQMVAIHGSTSAPGPTCNILLGGGAQYGRIIECGSQFGNGNWHVIGTSGSLIIDGGFPNAFKNGAFLFTGNVTSVSFSNTSFSDELAPFSIGGIVVGASAAGTVKLLYMGGSCEMGASPVPVFLFLTPTVGRIETFLGNSGATGMVKATSNNGGIPVYVFSKLNGVANNYWGEPTGPCVIVDESRLPRHTVTMTDADYTVAPNEELYRYIYFPSSLTLTADRLYQVPYHAQGVKWAGRNDSTGGHDVKIVGPSGAAVAITNGAGDIGVYDDGTNMVPA